MVLVPPLHPGVTWRTRFSVALRRPETRFLIGDNKPHESSSLQTCTGIP
jgi:hypothetical protein